ncbi:MAG: NADH:flavin oxidoreductase [Treponema sp.]|jgi:2,4-dienoyl-CoA reductase-like NADH-dependent reductase (Old Yellow Enzyme family)|nr:NADH:flavin oxidoreductase [Treponema sp.]
MKTLFDTTRLGGLTLKNRVVRAAVHEAVADGRIHDGLLGVYASLAQGGVGSIITGFALVDEAEQAFPLLAFYNDAFIEGHTQLVDRVHAYATPIILQLVYVGSYVMGDPQGMRILAPSAVANRNTRIMPQAISREAIKRIQRKFAEAALRAKQAGYDGVELHGAHGFLLSQFMTPYYNRRTDDYGGSAQNRARMIIETYEAVRQAVGDNFSVWIKLNVTDGFEQGVIFDDVLYVCEQLTQKGVDAIEISGAFTAFPPEATSYFKAEAETIAAANDTAVIVTGGNRHLQEMTEILNTTKIRYFGMARPLMKNPDLIKRFAQDQNLMREAQRMESQPRES